jgi:hypothetical protein
VIEKSRKRHLSLSVSLFKKESGFEKRESLHLVPLFEKRVLNVSLAKQIFAEYRVFF